MNLHKILKPTFIRKDKRGFFIEVLNGSSWEEISYGIIKKGACMGNHYHKTTDVFFFVTKGSVKIDFIHVKTKKLSVVHLLKNEGVIFKRNYSHAISFLEDSVFIQAKSKKYDVDYPDTYPFVVPTEITS